jgi:hypothetical protein
MLYPDFEREREREREEKWTVILLASRDHLGDPWAR